MATKKQRLFYLDFIRAIAAISIVITHFNARYIFRKLREEWLAWKKLEI